MRNYLKTTYGRFSVVRHGFWFVDIPRTSSSAIRFDLYRHFGIAHGKQNVLDSGFTTPQIFADHLSAKEMSNILGDSIWETLFTFTVVRNPWDRTFSIYNWRQKVCSIPKSWSFRDYVLALEICTSTSAYFNYHGHRYGAADYILGDKGNVIVDYVAKYENRLHDLQLIASRLNLDKLGVPIIQCASTDNKHYSQFYDDETVDIIRKLYPKDIEMFGYEFEKSS
jgi:hypothetical protein